MTNKIAALVGWIFIIFLCLGALGFTDVEFLVGKSVIAKHHKCEANHDQP